MNCPVSVWLKFFFVHTHTHTHTHTQRNKTHLHPERLITKHMKLENEEGEEAEINTSGRGGE